MTVSKWKIHRSIYLFRYFGIGIILLAVLGVCLFNYRAFDTISIGAVILSADLMVLAWLIVASFGRVLQNKYAIITILSLLMIYGVCVYGMDVLPKTDADFDYKSTLVLYPVVNTLSIFFPSHVDYIDSENSLSFWYYLFHFLGYFFAAWVLFSLLGKKVISRTLYWFIDRDKINVFWGYSAGGVVLAKDMIIDKQEFRQPVFVLQKKTKYDETEESRIVNELMDIGAIVLNEDIDEELNIDGMRHFFMTERQDFNVSLALRMVDRLNRQLSKLNKKTYLHVRTEVEGIDALFQAKYENNAALKSKVEVNLFSQSDLVARSFVWNNPLLDLAGREFKPVGRRMQIHPETATVSGECHVLLLGLGWSGFELLRKTVCDAQFLGDDFHFSVTVIDDDFQINKGIYLKIFNAARKLGIEINVNPTIYLNERGEIEGEDRSGLMGYGECDGFEKVSVHSVNGCYFYRWLEYNDNIMDFDRIIVSLGDDELNTNTAMQLHRFRLGFLSAYNAENESHMPEKIFAYVKDYRSYDFYKSEGSQMAPFGDFKEINSVKTLIWETMDKVAKRVNYVYAKYDLPQLTIEQLNDFDAVEDEWNTNDTNIFNQNSSRSVALNIANTVKIAGGEENFKTRVNDEFYIEKYAEMEHKRWNAFNLMYGVDVWDENEVSNKKGKLIFNGTLSRHICLVGYNELDKMSLKVRSLGNVNEDYKATDRRIVRHFFLFYSILKSN